MSPGHSDNNDTDKNIHPTKVNPPSSQQSNLDSDKQYFGDKSISGPLKHTSYICQNCNSSKNIKPNIKRSVSYNHRGRKESKKKQVLQRRETVLVTSNGQPHFHDYQDSPNHHLHHNLQARLSW